MSARPLRSLLAFSLSSALLAAGCAKPSEGGGEAKADEAADGGAPEPASGETRAEVAATKPTPAAQPTPAPDTAALAAAVASMAEPETSYPVALDPLLELVPAGSRSFVVVRDLDDLLALADGALAPVDPAMRAFAAAAGGDAADDVAQGLDGYATLAAGLRGGGFDLGKGLVVADVEGDGVVIYGTTKPDALPTLLRALGASGDDMPDECAAVEGAPGHAACAEDAETLAKYAPGKDAAAVRARLAERLDAPDVERANVLAYVGKDDDPEKRVAFTMVTSPGLVQFTMGLVDAPEELGRVLGSGPAPALGLMAPGSSFYWGKLDPTRITEQAKEQPFIVRNVLGTLTGEVVLGMLAEPPALVLLAGVSDPAPMGGLVALAGMQAGELPKTLADGSALAVATETLTLGGKATQVLHATLTPAGDGAALIGKMGLVPEAWLFAAGGYAGVVLGGGKAAVEAIAAHPGGGMSPEAARALPKPLAQALVDGTVSLAMHLSVDGLQSPQVAESFEAVAKEIPGAELPPGITPAQVMTLARSVMAPVSGLSVWMGPPKGHLVVHVAISLLGDPRTEEGKAAMAAMATVAGGGDPATAYGALADRFGSSERSTAYQARAGTHNDGALASVALLGALAAVAIPAVLKYQAKAAALRGPQAAPPAPPQ